MSKQTIPRRYTQRGQEPIENARVAENYNYHEATFTEADGSYWFPNVLEGANVIEASKPGYRSTSRAITLTG